MANFLWGSAGQKMSPAQVAEQRKIAQALMQEGSDTSPVGHWTAALNRGLQGYLGGRQAYQAREAENAGRAGLEAKRAGQANAAMFGGADPVAAALAGGQGAGGWSGGSLNLGGDLTSGIAETAAALGMDPVDLATIISYETAGTFDPTKAGPTTQWGQHRGLIQFGEPQAAEYGVDWNNPVGSQLGANGAIVNYFTKNGWQPGMGLLDAYSIVNAGAPGRYTASDANNGGAPGTVADKVNNQMAGHRQKAMSLFGGGVAAPANSTANIAALLADEWLPDSERAVLQAQYAQQLQQQDPMYQAQLQGAQLANQAAMQPKPAAAPDTQVFFDEATGQDYRAQWNPNTMSWDRVGGVKAPSGPLVNVDMGGSPGLGKLSTDFGYVLDEAGNPKIDPATGLPQAAPVPGTPAALALEKEKEGKDTRETSSANTAKIVLQDIDKAINQTGWSTSGLGGAILGKLPGSGATDLRATTDTIKANIGFDRLQQMRESSPTGGALGGIAVQELNMLQAVLGSLDQAQGPEQLRANLQRLKEIYEPIAAKAAAYPNAAQFGFDGAKPPESGAAAPSSQPKRLRYNQQTGAFE